MPIAQIAGLGAAIVAGGLYLEGRYNVVRDVKQLRSDKAFARRLDKRCKELGDQVKIYKMWEIADQNAEALWFEGRSWTYAAGKAVADKISALLLKKGIQSGDFVAVFMSNSPEMVFTVLALSNIGAVPSFINTALREETLAHCMKLANARMVIATPDLAEYLSPDHLGNAGVPLVLNLGFFGDIPKAGGDVVDEKSLESEYLPPSFSPPPRGLGDVAMVIYTSGTSGKPKAVSIKNFHLIIVSTPLQSDLDFPPEQGKQMRIFSCLPLFHGTAMFTAMLYGAGSSGTLCLARKFTASGFSRALYDSGATRMLYVGELCRYLIAAQPSPFDTAHQCRVASGNGLQADIWEKFQQRFGITHVREFYRGTEMVAKYDNFDGGKAAVGRCGFEGPLAKWLNRHTYIVKYDTKTEAPYRDPKTGFCVLAAADEPGEAIGRVNTMAFYHEYLNNQNANREKLMSDVFSKGDLFQRSGDLLVRSRDGWVRFLERSGDSYRWKGENVSAGEVKEHITRLPGVQEAEVFAVNLERYDGQAGAAAIVLNDPNFNSEESFCRQLYKRLRKTGLTVYQVPRLLRFTKSITVNATFKHLKSELKGRSWNPSNQESGDRLWWLDGKEYKVLDDKAWTSISIGKARL